MEYFLPLAFFLLHKPYFLFYRLMEYPCFACKSGPQAIIVIVCGPKVSVSGFQN